MSQPAYHLRPHKAVDRNLFCETLRHLSRIDDISRYRYVGFGSYEFDDFKMMYRNFGIEDMHSIEKELGIFVRQEFNKPYDFIKLYNKDCGTYIDESFDETQKCIFWLDFSNANDKESQCEDIVNLFSKVSEGNIIRITLNAHANNIESNRIDAETVCDNRGSFNSSDLNTAKRQKRLGALRKSIGDYLPDGVVLEDVESSRYPYLLMKVIRRAAYKGLSDELSICPICAYTYADGQRMLTVTLRVIDRYDRGVQIDKIKGIFSDWSEFVGIGDWEKIVPVELPPLTLHEQLELSQGIKTEIAETSMKTGIKKEDIEKFYKFLRYYPNYQPVII